VARRSVMTLFSAPADPWSHRTRLVLAEKGIAIELVNVDPNALPEDLIDLNPYHSVPTLVDRDLVLYDSRVIIEYLDERFPHPPLMPIDPVTRAQFRVALYRVERDWYALAHDIDRAVAGDLQLAHLLVAGDALRGELAILGDADRLDGLAGADLGRFERFVALDFKAAGFPFGANTVRR